MHAAHALQLNQLIADNSININNTQENEEANTVREKKTTSATTTNTATKCRHSHANLLAPCRLCQQNEAPTITNAWFVNYCWSCTPLNKRNISTQAIQSSAKENWPSLYQINTGTNVMKTAAIGDNKTTNSLTTCKKIGQAKVEPVLLHATRRSLFVLFVCDFARVFALERLNTLQVGCTSICFIVELAINKLIWRETGETRSIKLKIQSSS